MQKVGSRAEDAPVHAGELWGHGRVVCITQPCSCRGAMLVPGWAVCLRCNRAKERPPQPCVSTDGLQWGCAGEMTSILVLMYHGTHQAPACGSGLAAGAMAQSCCCATIPLPAGSSAMQPWPGADGGVLGLQGCVWWHWELLRVVPP